MTEKILTATHAGDLKIGNVILPCSVLETHARVLSMRGINTAFTGTRGGGTVEKDGAQNLPRFLSTNDVLPFISNDLMARITTPIEYKPLHGGRSAFGYEASLLPEICEVILDAEKAGKLKSPAYAKIAEILIRGFARVGIVALIDEVTGYQEIRDKDALQALLDKYLLKEYAVWAKRFPDDFYKDMFRLKGWQWQGMHVNRPSVVGRHTNDLVYERLAPGILDELQKKNPKDDKGQRPVKHHQFFTDEIGHPALSQHIHAVMGFMRASTTWDQFLRMMNRAFPKKGQQLTLLDDDD